MRIITQSFFDSTPAVVSDCSATAKRESSA